MNPLRIIGTGSNAKFFPDDSLWQKHCARVAAYLNAIQPDNRVDLHSDCLAPEGKGL